MAILRFSGDFVASQFSIDDNEDGETEFEIDETPFLSTDIVRIEIDDASIGPNGEFDPDEVYFLSFSVERAGVEYQFGVNSGSKVKESGGGSNAEQGDTYFLLNDSVSPPPSGPFSGLDTQTYLFSLEVSFASGPDEYTLQQDADVDLNEDGDTSDSGESGDSNFNVLLNVVCFGRGTKIQTITGEVPVEELRPETMVLTASRGYRPVRLVCCSRHRFTEVNAQNRPVLFEAGSLGAGLPTRPLVVSPQHRMVVPGWNGDLAALAPSKAFTCLKGIRHMRGKREIDYFHLVFDQHEIIFASGAPTESFYPGPMAMRAMSGLTRARILGFLEQRQHPATHYGYDPAYAIMRVRDARNILETRGHVWTPKSLAASFSARPEHAMFA